MTSHRRDGGKSNRFYARARAEIEAVIVAHATRYGIAIRSFNLGDHNKAIARARVYRMKERNKRWRSREKEVPRLRVSIELVLASLGSDNLDDPRAIAYVRAAIRALDKLARVARKGGKNKAIERAQNRIHKAHEELVPTPTVRARAVAALVQQRADERAEVDPVALVKSQTSNLLTAGEDDPYIMDHDT